MSSPSASDARPHWPEYLIEALALGFFMLSAALFTALLEHPASPVHRAVPDPSVRRGLMGLAMGLTAVAIIYSPWGARSGAHINPAVTLTFLRLNRIRPRDAVFYVVAQFTGAAAGVALAAVLLMGAAAFPTVNYAVTLPGPSGPGVAFAAEMVISFLLMTSVLIFANSPRLMRLTGIAAGTLVALYITFEAPLSGMSMNPARSFGSAALAGVWNDYWVYVFAPPLAMLAAGETYVRLRGTAMVHCAKLNHAGRSRCIFRCDQRRLDERRQAL